MTQSGDERGRATQATSITMPTDLIAYARGKAPGGNLSAWISGLVDEHRRQERVWKRLAQVGYTGDLAPTDAGRARFRARLDAHRAKQAGTGDGTGQRAA
jgi:hypothetical protein